MKTIFNPNIREELANRINALNENSIGLWGKMSLNQMLKHTAMCEEMYLGKRKMKRSFLGRIIGKTILKNILKDDNPMRKNSPTMPEVKMTEAVDSDINTLKKYWIDSLDEYKNFNNPSFIHPFFGKMNQEEIGLLAYKHADHHLRQFGC